jgi:hypothetical protein
MIATVMAILFAESYFPTRDQYEAALRVKLSTYFVGA